MDALSPEEVRILGSLIEKSLTTPDNYPLTQNALIAACNQLSNRNPVVAYDDNTVRLTLNGLRTRSLARIIHVPGSRAPKHRHVLDEALELDPNELALLCVLMLRGAQTTGELRARTERMTEFSGLGEIEDCLEALADRSEPLVLRLERAPGQKESRWTHLLGGEPDPADVAAGQDAERPWAGADRPAVRSAAPPRADRPPVRSAAPPRADRLADLEARVEALEAALAGLRRQLGQGDSGLHADSPSGEVEAPAASGAASPDPDGSDADGGNPDGGDPDGGDPDGSDADGSDPDNGDPDGDDPGGGDPNGGDSDDPYQTDDPEAAPPAGYPRWP